MAPRTRCALISSKRDRKTVLEALRSGACGYLLKSANASQLGEALNQLMQEVESMSHPK